MVNIIDTPPVTASATDRDRVSLLEVVGCAALLSVLVWTVVSLFQDEPVFRTPAPLSSYGPWVAGTVGWAVLITVAVRHLGRIVQLVLACIGGAFLPLALLFGGITHEGESSAVGAIAATLTVALTTAGTVLLMWSPRQVRGIVAIIGFLAILLFFTAAFGQAFLGALRPASA